MQNPYNPQAIFHHAYRDLLTGHYHMRRRYHIRRPRGTDDWLLICTLRGRGLFRRDNQSLPANPGDLVLLPPGTPHDYGLDDSLRRWELLWAHFRPLPIWQPLLNWPEPLPGIMRLQLPNTLLRRQVIDRFHDVHRLAIGSLPRRDWFALNALESLLLWCDSLNPRSTDSTLDPRIQTAVDHILQNLRYPLTLTSLARVAGLSPSRFSTLFRKQLSTTPQRFIEAQRMDRAKRLLQIPQMRITDIAAEVGFPDPFYFSQRFRRHSRLSPRAYRQSMSRPSRKTRHSASL